MQLYATRSAASSGIGDLGDLRRICRWARDDLGAGFAMVNPLHAPLPGLPQQASPYFPSSRRFRNPLYVCLDDVPGATAGGAVADRAGLIDRDAVWATKMSSLHDAWSQFAGDPAFDEFCVTEEPSLTAFATFCVLYEELGGPWWEWPEGVRHPGGPGVAAFRDAHRCRVDYHRWLQWVLDTQLAAAAAELPIVGDLAVGFDPGGADAWELQDAVAPGVSIGAPPDAFNHDGQDWGLAALDPQGLEAAGFEPIRQTLEAALAHAGGLRVDHVMGLFRLWWVPQGGLPTGGRYVRYPADALLDVLAAESRRSGAFVVGEDLGTVEEGVREELARRNVLSYRLLWFEDGPPATYPELALAAVTTHDLPTVAGVWTGADPAAAELRPRLVELAGAADGAPVSEVVEQTYGALAEAPSLLLAATLDDMVGMTERPNMPGTTVASNWSRPLPALIEDLVRDPRPRRIAEILRR